MAHKDLGSWKINAALALFLTGFIWINLGYGWIVINMGTWKFVPACLLISVSLMIALIRNPVSYSFKKGSPGFLLLLLSIAVMLNIFPGSFGGDTYDFLFDTSGRLSLLAVAVTTVLLVDNSQKRKIFLLVSMFIGVVFIILGFIETIVNLSSQSLAGMTVKGTFNNPNLFAGVLILYIPVQIVFLSYSKSKTIRILQIIAVILSMTLLFLTGCRSAIIALFASLFCGALILAKDRIKDKKSKALIILSLILLVILIISMAAFIPSIRMKFLTTEARGGESRLLIYPAAVKMWMQNPKTFFIGNGPGSFRKLLPQYSYAWYYREGGRSSWHAVHNEYIQRLVEGGLAALLSFLVFLYFLIRVYLKKMGDKSNSPFTRILSIGIILSITAFLTDALFSSNFRELPNAALFYMIAFLGIGEEKQGVEQKRAVVFRIVLITAVSILLLYTNTRQLLRMYTDRILYVSTRIENKDRKIKILELAGSVEPQYIVPAMMLCRETLSQGKMDDFIRTADIVEGIIPSFLDIHYLRGQAYSVQNKHNLAIGEYQKHLENGFYDLHAETLLMFSYLWTGEKENALSILKSIAAKDRTISFREDYTLEFSDINKIEIQSNPTVINIGDEYILKKLFEIIENPEFSKDRQIIEFHMMMLEIYNAAGLKQARIRHKNQISKF